MIDLTPLDVRKKKGDFRRGMRGYEMGGVDDFLDLVADRMEQLVRDNLALTERVARLEEQIRETRDRERALTDALVTAQEMREDIRQQTLKEAELARREAEVQAARILREAAESVEREQDAVRQLRARQRQVLASYRSFLERELTELAVAAEALERAGREESLPAREARPRAAEPGAAGAGSGAGSARAEAGAVATDSSAASARAEPATGRPERAAPAAAAAGAADVPAEPRSKQARAQDEFELLKAALEEEL